MQDFFEAGGLRGLIARLGPAALTARPSPAGRCGETLEGAEVYDDDVIRPLDNPL